MKADCYVPLKQCIPELLPIVTTIVNTSLVSGHVPVLYKSVIIRPHLKKSNLDSKERGGRFGSGGILLFFFCF